MLADAQAADMNPDASPQAEIAVSYIEGGPKLDPGSLFYWNAFMHLHTARPQALAGVPHIPFPLIVQYADYWGLNRVAADRLIKVIDIVDAWYIAEQKRENG